MLVNIGLPGLVLLLGGGTSPELWLAVLTVPVATLFVPPFYGLTAVAAL